MKIWKKPASTKRGQPRRRVVPLWRNRIARISAAVLLVIVASGGVWWSWQSGAVQRGAAAVKWKIIAVTADMGLTVQNILVFGRRETPRRQLLSAVRLARGAPILAFDPEDARKRVEQLPWVRTATVERRLPDTILLRIVERQPMALWQHRGRFALIDPDGVVIEEDGNGRFPGLLVVVGEDAPAFAAQLQQVLMTEPELMVRVKAAVRVGGRRWNLRLDSGIDVRLPEADAASAWARLAEYERSHRVLARDVKILDLRLPDRLIVRKSPRTNKPTAAGGRET